MTILIDTQVLLWLTNQDKALGSTSTRYLTNTANRVLVSYFSLFEIVIKTSVGKMTYDESIIEDFNKMGVELVMPDLENLWHYRITNSDNKDPFDNMLIAVAQTEKCIFMTSDKKILNSNVKNVKLLDAKS